MTTLRDLRGLDLAPVPGTGVITGINADGSVVVDLGGGQVVVARCADTYAPTFRATVAVDEAAGVWWVRHGVRTSNATTQLLVASWPTPYRVLPSAVSTPNPLVINAIETRSWRSTDGWSRPEVYQGRYYTSDPYWYGCAFYGVGALAALQGRTCTFLRARIGRSASGGVVSGQAMWVAPHAHPTRPAGQPMFTAAAVSPSSALDLAGVPTSATLDRSQTKRLVLPTEWGQDLIDGRAHGFGLLLLASGNGAYSISPSIASDGLQWQLEIGWS